MNQEQVVYINYPVELKLCLNCFLLIPRTRVQETAGLPLLCVSNNYCRSVRDDMDSWNDPLDDQSSMWRRIDLLMSGHSLANMDLCNSPSLQLEAIRTPQSIANSVSSSALFEPIKVSSCDWLTDWWEAGRRTEEEETFDVLNKTDTTIFE